MGSTPSCWPAWSACCFSSAWTHNCQASCHGHLPRKQVLLLSDSLSTLGLTGKELTEALEVRRVGRLKRGYRCWGGSRGDTAALPCMHSSINLQTPYPCVESCAGPSTPCILLAMQAHADKVLGLRELDKAGAGSRGSRAPQSLEQHWPELMAALSRSGLLAWDLGCAHFFSDCCD